MSSEKQEEKVMPNAIKFLFGGSAGMAATLFVQPLDLIKNRMQLDKTKEYRSSVQAFTSILRKEGLFAMYNGLSAGLLRQATYTTTRLGTYNLLLTKFKSEDGTPPNFFQKASFGIAAGATGAFVGTPAEVALVRMTADGRLPLAERRNYANVFHALYRITSQEGVLTLWRGAVPTIGRAMVVNAAQLASYSQAKQILLSFSYFEENIFCHFVSSMISAFITTVASMPVDIAKTRIQSMKTIDGKPEFKGTIDVLSRVVKQEGVLALWKGFMPYFLRIGPHTVLTFVFLEQMCLFYNEKFLGDKTGKGSGL